MIPSLSDHCLLPHTLSCSCSPGFLFPKTVARREYLWNFLWFWLAALQGLDKSVQMEQILEPLHGCDLEPSRSSIPCSNWSFLGLCFRQSYSSHPSSYRSSLADLSQCRNCTGLCCSSTVFSVGECASPWSLDCLLLLVISIENMRAKKLGCL